MTHKTYKATALSAAVAVALGSTAPNAVAQEDELEEVVVTGSYIRRTEYEGRAPIQIVDSEAISLIGAAQPADVISQLSANSGSQFYNETNDRQGVIQFNIRNLGLGSTLTLLNGKRAGIAAVADASGADFVDLNQYPLVMIERIDVLTNGASATYGSQAVAGVANIITRKGFEGFEISGGLSDADIDTWDLSIAAGSQFDKGGFNVYATYYEQDRIGRTGFGWLDSRLNGNGDQSRSSFLSGTGSPGSNERATLGANGEATSVAGAVRLPDQDCEAAGGVIGDPEVFTSPTAQNTCRYNFADQVSVIAAEKRFQVFTEFDWELNDNTKYYMEANFSTNEILRDTGGTLLATGKATNGGVTVLPSHPFNFFVEDPNSATELIYIGPENWDPAIHCTDINSAASCQFQTATLRNIHRPLGPAITGTDLAPEASRTLDYTRVLNGLEITLPGDWFLDVSYMWARAQAVNNNPSSIRSDTYQQLVRDGARNPFGTRLSNPGLVSPKDPADTVNCFNVDFGGCVAANSDTVESSWNQSSVSQSYVTEQVVDLVASGELFELGGSAVYGAIGGQYRDVSYNSYPDSLNSAGEGGGQGISGAVVGGQDVWAVFAEVVAPLGDFGEVQLAVRNEDYGSGVSTTDPKVSFELGLTERIAARASWGTSFQAPTVRQTGLSTSSAFIDDPASATGPGGSFVCTDVGQTNNIAVIVQGAAGLQPQEAENFNIGLVWQGDALRASLDYFYFDYTDLIAAEAGPQAIVNEQCPNGNDGSPIVEDPRVIRDATAQVREVSSEFVNIGAVETSGMDLNVDYGIDIGDGQLNLNAGLTYLFDFDVDSDGDGTFEFDGAGSRNFTNSFDTLPELRANAGATYFWGEHLARLGLNYIDEYTNDQGNDRLVDSWTTLDAQYSYTFNGLIGDGDTTLTLGMNNITDEEPPGLLTNNSDGTPQQRFNPNGSYNRGLFQRPGYDDRAGHDLRGRIVYLRFKHAF